MQPRFIFYVDTPTCPPTADNKTSVALTVNGCKRRIANILLTYVNQSLGVHDFMHLSVLAFRHRAPVKLKPTWRQPDDVGSTRLSKNASPPPHSLRLSLLTALVVGSMLGSGIFSLPQTSAAGAAPGAVLLAWLITGAGMLMLTLVYQTLALRKPDLNNGIYAYARAGAGDFIGFHAAWGYWTSVWIGNVGFLVIFFGTLGDFFPIFGDGSTRAAIGGASLMLWVIHAMILHGMREVARLNALITVAKVAVLLIYSVVLACAFKRSLFVADFWGQAHLGSVHQQIKSTLLSTVWVFIGIEGASVLSARARCRADVGRATVWGFGIVLGLLMVVSLLSFGVLTQPQLASLKHPSMAGLLEHIVGRWGAVFINLGLLISVGGSLLAWTLLAAETLLTPARDGMTPRFLRQENGQGMPTGALWLTSGLTQLLLLITLAVNATYSMLISLATSMILVPYLFSAFYACRIAVCGEGYAVDDRTRWRDILIGAAATLYCCWLLYGAGLKYLLLSALLYAPGSILYSWAKRQHKRHLSTVEILLLIGQFGLAALAIWLLAIGALHL